MKSRIFTMILGILMSLVLSACTPVSQSNVPSAAATSVLATMGDGDSAVPSEPEAGGEPSSVRFYTPGPASGGWSAAQEAINAIIGPELNVELDVIFASGDYGQQLQMELAAGQVYSWVYDATWSGLANNLASDAYIALDDLIPAHAPTLWDTKGEIAWEANKMPGPDGTYRIYLIPNGSTYQTCYQFWARKDLRETMGIPALTTRDEFVNFLYAVKENYPDIIPITPSLSGYMNYTNMMNVFSLDRMPGYISNTPLGKDEIIYMINNDGKFIIVDKGIKPKNRIKSGNEPPTARAVM